MKKLISLALALLMVLSMIPASAETAYTQAPMLDGMDLPPVAERLPLEPMVEDADYLTIGTYGGELRRAADGGNWYNGKPIEEGLFRFTTQGTVEPNVAKGFSVNEDATVYTIYLREGMKWSDGAPFTAEDCVWFYNAVCMNKVDSKGIRNCHKDANGNPAVVEKVDDYTFTVTFGTPKYDFIEALTVDLKWHFAPKHIFEKMVQATIDGDAATALAEAKAICGVEFSDTGKAGKELLYYFWNYKGVPTLNPYVLSTEEGKNDVKGQYYEYVRNPYYWKVDKAGQQLPYIDKIAYIKMSDDSQNLLSLLDGTIDMYLGGLNGLAEMPAAKVSYHTLYEDDMVLLVPDSHPLAKETSIDLRQCQNEGFIHLEASTNLQQFINVLFRQAGVEPRVLMVFDYTLRDQMVADGHGISITTRLAAQKAEVKNVTYIPISHPAEKRLLGLVWGKNQGFSPAMQHFFNAAKEFYSRL